MGFEDILNQGEVSLRRDSPVAVNSTQYPRDQEMGDQQECTSHGVECRLRSPTRLDLETQQIQLGLGPAHLEDLDLFKDSIGLKNKVVLLDYPSPKDPTVRYGGAELNQAQISKAKEKVSKDLVNISFNNKFYANLAALDCESEGDGSGRHVGTGEIVDTVQGVIFSEKEVEEPCNTFLDKTVEVAPCTVGNFSSNDVLPQDKRERYGRYGRVKPSPLPFINLRIQKEVPGFIMHTGMNHVYVGQGSGYGPFDNLSPMTEQSGPVTKASIQGSEGEENSQGHIYQQDLKNGLAGAEDGGQLDLLGNAKEPEYVVEYPSEDLKDDRGNNLL